MNFDLSQLKISTKSLLAVVTGVGAMLQIPAVSTPVFEFGNHHPHFAAAIALITGAAALLHNPQVKAVLGIEESNV